MKITKEFEKAIRDAFLLSITDIKNTASMSDLDAAIKSGEVGRIMQVLGISPAAFTRLETSINGAFIAGAADTSQQIGKIAVPAVGAVTFRANMQSPSARDWLQTVAGRFVVDISKSQFDAIKVALDYGVARGDNPRAIALDLVGRIDPATRKRVGGVVGNTAAQTKWTNNARDELEALNPAYFNRVLRDKRFDPTIRAAMDAGTPVPASTVNGAITSMQNRTLKFRGDAIGRTEALNALRAGQASAITQAVEEAGLPPQEATKVWDSSGDSNTRETHAAADGQEVGLDQPFIVGGYYLMFAGDDSMGAPPEEIINCRCVTDYKIDFIGRAVRLDGYE